MLPGPHRSLQKGVIRGMKDRPMEIHSAGSVAGAAANTQKSNATDEARENERKAARDSEVERREAERAETGPGVGERVDIEA